MYAGGPRGDDIAQPSSAGTRKSTQSRDRFLDDYLAYLLMRAAHVVSDEFDRMVQRQGLTASTWRIMALLADRPGLTMGELSRICLIKLPTLSKTTDRMEAEGLVRRETVQEDRRQVRVILTERGEQMILPLIEQAKQHEREVLSGLSEQQIADLKSALGGLIDTCLERAQ